MAWLSVLSTIISTTPSRITTTLWMISPADAAAPAELDPLNSSRVGRWATAVTTKKVRKFRDSTDAVRFNTRPTRKSLSEKRAGRDASVMDRPIDLAYSRWSRLATSRFTGNAGNAGNAGNISRR